MGILALAADERVANVEVTDTELSVTLMDGRTIIVPLAWYPRLLNASEAERKKWQIGGGGYGIHWPDIDEDLSTEGLLRGAPAPRQQFSNENQKDQDSPMRKAPWHSTKGSVYHDNAGCTTGNNISDKDLRQGTGGKPLCHECRSLNKFVRPPAI
jgi:Protein of unknown function (DUF2442)